MSDEREAPERGAVDDVWVRLDGVLAERLDPPSTWAIGAKLPGAEDALKLASAIGKVYVYGDVCVSIKGQRTAQRWLIANDLLQYIEWVTHYSEPPKGVEVIDRWPMTTQNS